MFKVGFFLRSTLTDARFGHVAFSLSLQEGGDKFISGEYHGPNHRSKMSEEELLAAEMMRTSGRETETSQESVQLTAASGVRSVSVSM